MNDSRPIGVFDSGVGGLTVLAALRSELPSQRFVYLGDTARLPYGTKSPETVVRYALRAAEALVARDIRALVVACNTASAVSLPALRERFPDLPVFGVVEPGAELACATSRSGRIAVLATEGTVRGGAYERAIMARRPDARVTSVACQVFVALAEEGWHRNGVALAAAAEYLRPLFATADTAPDCVVLGCTHFPLLRAAIAENCAPDVAIIDSAASAAVRVALALSPAERLTARAAGPIGAHPMADSARLHCLATDGLERFRRIAPRFLGETLEADQLELVEI